MLLVAFHVWNEFTFISVEKSDVFCCRSEREHSEMFTSSTQQVLISAVTCDFLILLHLPLLCASHKSWFISVDIYLLFCWNSCEDRDTVFGVKRGIGKFSSKKSKQILDKARLEIQELNDSLNPNVSPR